MAKKIELNDLMRKYDKEMLTKERIGEIQGNIVIIIDRELYYILENGKNILINASFKERQRYEFQVKEQDNTDYHNKLLAIASGRTPPKDG